MVITFCTAYVDNLKLASRIIKDNADTIGIITARIYEYSKSPEWEAVVSEHKEMLKAIKASIKLNENVINDTVKDYVKEIKKEFNIKEKE
jgi:hypothetical protein